MNGKRPQGVMQGRQCSAQWTTTIRNRLRSARVYSAAAISSALFSFAESSVKSASEYATPELYVLARAVLLYVMFNVYVVLRNIGRIEGKVTLLPLSHIAGETWVRGFLGSLSLTFMSIALWTNSTQTFTYSFFLLHPLFTLLLMPSLINRTLERRKQLWPISLSVTGAVGYAIANQVTVHGMGSLPVWDVEQLFYEYAAPALAGLAFAGENLMSKRIEARYRLDSLTISYHSAFVTAVTIPVCAFFTYLLVRQAPRFDWQLAFFMNLTTVSVLALFANILLTTAFAEATDAQLPTVAVLDLAVLPYAVLIGLMLTSDLSAFEGPRALFSPAGGMLLLILVGAAWSVAIRGRNTR